MLVGLGVLDMVEGEKHMIVGTKRKEDLGVVTKTKQKKRKKQWRLWVEKKTERIMAMKAVK